MNATRALFPSDAPNWTRGGSKDGPFDCSTLGSNGTLDRLYCSWNGSRARCAAVNVRKATVLTARQPMTASVHDTLDGRLVLKATLLKGQSMTLLPDVPGAVVVVE
jgi:hypothetical protein